jgi:hypothetical protein
VHLAQEQVWALAAAGASAVTIMNVGHAIRWFALFLCSQRPDQGRAARSVGRAGVVAYLGWLAQRVRDSEDFQRLDPADPRRAVIAERLLPSLADPTRRTPLSDAEITRRARVNGQYLQRHRDLKALAARIRADLDGDAARAAVAARSEREAALAVENAMLVEQNAQLRRDLDAARDELRTLRVQELAQSNPPPACSPAACTPPTRPWSTCARNATMHSPSCAAPRPTVRRCATSTSGSWWRTAVCSRPLNSGPSEAIR